MNKTELTPGSLKIEGETAIELHYLMKKVQRYVVPKPTKAEVKILLQKALRSEDILSDLLEAMMLIYCKENKICSSTLTTKE